MSERGELLGHVIYHPEDETVEAWMECLDCHEGYPEGHTTAAYRDSETLGAEVPYSECAVCGEVIRP